MNLRDMASISYLPKISKQTAKANPWIMEYKPNQDLSINKRVSWKGAKYNGTIVNTADPINRFRTKCPLLLKDQSSLGLLIFIFSCIFGTRIFFQNFDFIIFQTVDLITKSQRKVTMCNDQNSFFPL